jgi:hypothetical protein
MTKTWQKQTGTVRLRWNDTGEEIRLSVISTFREERSMRGVDVIENATKKIVDPNGRSVCNQDEKTFFFCDDPSRTMTLVN